MMTARAQVLANLGAEALRSWQPKVDEVAMLAQPVAQQAGTFYGAALAAIRLRDAGLARRNLTRLQNLVSTDPQAQSVVSWLQTEIDLSAADLAPLQLRARMSNLGQSDVTASDLHRPALLLLAQAAITLNQPNELNSVAQSLQTWLSFHPHDPLAWDWLASIYAAQNQVLRSLRAQAEAQAARLDFAGALDRLKAAQDRIRFTGSKASSAEHIDASIIDTRLRQIEVLLKNQTPPA
jgi:predicted Zn-dependent protease